MHWQLHKQQIDLQKELAGAAGVLPITAHILINRGITTEKTAMSFMNPSLQQLHDPFLMKGMATAVSRIFSAIAGGERITVYGDYDADGVTSTALLLNFFKSIGVAADYYIPHRINEGYGLHKDSIDKLKERGAQLVITVDNGINAFDEILHAKTIGLDVIITDHHEPPAKLPPAAALINPKQPGCKFPFKGLAGCGVVFNLIVALRQRLREKGFFDGKTEPRLRDLLDIVAVGTVADVVPLIDENRLFVKFGLEELKKSTNRGLAALKVMSGLEAHQINATSIAFRLAPRINAAGRIDDQNLGVELLTTDDPEKATAIAQQLHSANARRQSIEAMILKEADEMIKCDPEFESCMGLVVEKEGWHPGVIGIVATRISQQYKKPAVVFGIEGGVGRGSARSVGEFNIVEVLDACSDLLVRFGGHKHAAGLTILPENITAFKRQFDDIVKATLKDEDRIDNVLVDTEANSEEISEQLINELELLEPFGEGNPEPVLCIRELKVSTARIVGEKHLKLKFTDNLVTLDAIGFDMAHHKISVEDILDVAFIPQRDTWKGKGYVQLKLRALKSV